MREGRHGAVCMLMYYYRFARNGSSSRSRIQLFIDVFNMLDDGCGDACEVAIGILVTMSF